MVATGARHDHDDQFPSSACVGYSDQVIDDDNDDCGEASSDSEVEVLNDWSERHDALQRQLDTAHRDFRVWTAESDKRSDRRHSRNERWSIFTLLAIFMAVCWGTYCSYDTKEFITSSMSTMSFRLTSLEARINDTETSGDRVLSEISELKSDHKTTSSEVKGLQATFLEIEDMQDVTSAQVDALKNSFEAIIYNCESRIGELERQLDFMSQSIPKQIESLRSYVLEILENMIDQEYQLVELNKAIEESYREINAKVDDFSA